MIRPDEYWAGQTDGDGCIGLPRFEHGCRIAFKTTCEMTVRAFHSDMRLGYVYFCYPPSSRKPGWKPRWAFEANAKDALEIIHRLQPYLIEKAEKARALLGHCEELPRTDAYFAGLVDAEGHIGLPVTNGAKRPALCVKMVHGPTVRALYDAMGVGKLRENWLSPSAARSGRRPQSHYRVATRDALYVVARLRPFLLTKADAADAVIAYYENGQHTRDKKLNREKRNELRRRYAAGERQSALAIEFGISHVTVSNICTNLICKADLT